MPGFVRDCQEMLSLDAQLKIFTSQVPIIKTGVVRVLFNQIPAKKVRKKGTRSRQWTIYCSK